MSRHVLGRGRRPGDRSQGCHSGQSGHTQCLSCVMTGRVQQTQQRWAGGASWRQCRPMPGDTNRCRKRRRNRLRKLEGGVLDAVSCGCPLAVQVELCNQQCPRQLRQPPPGSLSELREEGGRARPGTTSYMERSPKTSRNAGRRALQAKPQPQSPLNLFLKKAQYIMELSARCYETILRETKIKSS